MNENWNGNIGRDRNDWEGEDREEQMRGMGIEIEQEEDWKRRENRRKGRRTEEKKEEYSIR